MFVRIDHTWNREINKVSFEYLWVTSGRVIKLLKSAGRGGLFNTHHAVQIFYCSGLHIKWRMRRTPAAPRDVPGIVKKPNLRNPLPKPMIGVPYGAGLSGQRCLLYY